MKENEVDFEKVMQIPMTRRNLLGGAALLSLAGGDLVREYDRKRQEDYDKDFIGYSPLEVAEFQELVLNHQELPILIPSVEDEEPQDGALREISFSLDSPSQVYCYISGEYADPVFVEPLIIQRDENEEKFLAPVIHSTREKPIETSLLLGNFSEGDHTLQVFSDPSASFPRSEPPKVRLTIPEESSLLARFYEASPITRVKNPDNVLDDIPLMSFSNIGKRDDMYRLKNYIIFSSENGGTQPVKLNREYQRTVDIEWVMEQLFDSQGNVQKGRRKLQTTSHRSKQFHGSRSLDNQPVLDTATANNLFDDGMITLPVIHYTFNNPFHSFGEDEIFYSPKPVFLPGVEGGADLVDQYPEMQKWSLFELSFENCMEPNDPVLQEFLADFEKWKPYIHGQFPDRRCSPLFSIDQQLES